MTGLKNATVSTRAVLLVAFSSLNGYAVYARGRNDAELFRTMAGYAEFAGGIIEEAGGRVVKYIGDAILCVFPGSKADMGVKALIRLRSAGDSRFKRLGLPMRHRIKAHFGPVACGPFGAGSEKHFDVYGETVNTAACVVSQGLAVTERLFRKLPPGMKKLFKKQVSSPVYNLPPGKELFLNKGKR